MDERVQWALARFRDTPAAHHRRLAVHGTVVEAWDHPDGRVLALAERAYDVPLVVLVPPSVAVTAESLRPYAGVQVRGPWVRQANAMQAEFVDLRRDPERGRWRDLLVREALALLVLLGFGMFFCGFWFYNLFFLERAGGPDLAATHWGLYPYELVAFLGSGPAVHLGGWWAGLRGSALSPWPVAAPVIVCVCNAIVHLGLNFFT